MNATDWVAWHDRYNREGGVMGQRLAHVQAQIKPEPVVHEPRAVHRHDRGADWRAVTPEPLAQTTKSICVRWCGTNLDRHTLIVEQVQVETLATEW